MKTPSSILPHSMVSTAALAHVTRPNARSARSGIRRGWPSRRRWFPAAGWSTRRPDGLSLADVAPTARDYDLAVPHTSAPLLAADARAAHALKAENPKLRIGLVGAHVAVSPEESLLAATAVDFVARTEFDYTLKEVAEGRSLERRSMGSVSGADGCIRHNARPCADPRTWIDCRS